jgi:hypothetical protein
MQEFLITVAISVSATLAVVYFWSYITAWATQETTLAETAFKSKFAADVAAAKAEFDAKVATAAKSIAIAKSSPVPLPAPKAVAPVAIGSAQGPKV